MREIVEAVHSIPHGRPRERTAAGVVENWRGTCSTKGLLVRSVLPGLEVRFVHRVFRLTPEAASPWLGADVARVVPPEGLIDVHTYMTANVGGRRVVLDLTFPHSPAWDGVSDMQVPFPLGDDFEAGEDPIASKEELVARFGDASLRRRLIDAIS